MTRIARLLPVLALVACGDTTPRKTPTSPETAWSSTVAFEAGMKLGGCAVGDLDPTAPGNEIAAVSVEGAVFLVRSTGDGWEGAEIARVAGEMIQCAIGDADPDRDGNELLIVGMETGSEDGRGSGAAHLVFRDGDGWATETVFVDEALIHGGAIGDVDPRHPGTEVVTVGFSGRTTVLGKRDGAWVTLWSQPLPGSGKTVVCQDGVAWIANTGDALASAWASDDGVHGGTGPSLGAAGARIAAHEGRRLVACDDGGLRLVEGEQVRTIHREGARLRGAVLADLDPLVPGIEAATAGYQMTVTLLYPGEDPAASWTPVTLVRDTAKFHHLAAGELTATGHGLELVAVGYSGRVFVASRTRR